LAEPRFLHTILVVDDEPGITRLCSRLLQKGGFRVLTATSPQEGASILERAQVHLLLVDIRMPEMDGFQLITQARQRRPDLAVVIMTGFGTVETAIEALNQGADDLVLKPFTGDELVKSVQRALQESQQKQDILRLQTLRPLFTITESLFTETNPARLKDLLLETVCGHLKCVHAGLYKYMVGNSAYILMAGRGSMPYEEVSDPQTSIICRADQWNMALNGSQTDRKNFQLRMGGNDTGAMMAAPLRLAPSIKQSEAVLVAVRGLDEPAFRDSDLEIFAILARQAAVAMENARLHEELIAYIRRLEDSQRALIQAEKMATAGRLTATIAHEINNPLQSVQNCLHLAGRKEIDFISRQNYLSMAQCELDRLMNTVQRMLDYYRPGALDRKPVDVNNLIKNVMKLLESQISSQAVKVMTSYAPSLPLVLVVADQIQQVLLNLILNSLEAMPDGGDLYLQTSGFDERLEIVIEDSGPGVPAERRTSIFEPFTSTKEGGTGLGLAVSYGIIAAHGGSLDLLTGKGKGACFQISLPCGDAL
jgi:two-component system, NtrC family, sensor kinase